MSAPEPCHRCGGAQEIEVEVTCCRGSVYRIECACGGRPMLDWAPCPECAGGYEPTRYDDEWMVA